MTHELGQTTPNQDEGETLAERLKQGVLPLDQAFRYEVEMAHALDKAHRKGWCIGT